MFRVALAHRPGDGGPPSSLPAQGQCDPMAGAAAAERVVGGWGTKLEALLRR